MFFQNPFYSNFVLRLVRVSQNPVLWFLSEDAESRSTCSHSVSRNGPTLIKKPVPCLGWATLICKLSLSLSFFLSFLSLSLFTLLIVSFFLFSLNCLFVSSFLSWLFVSFLFWLFLSFFSLPVLYSLFFLISFFFHLSHSVLLAYFFLLFFYSVCFNFLSFSFLFDI